MSAAIATVNSKAALAYVGETPWHGLGTEVDESFSRNIPEFIKAANLDWVAEKRQLKRTVTGVDGTTEDVPANAWEVVRASDGKVLADMVGSKYTVLQNVDAFNWFTPFLETDEARLHTAGALFEGARIWVLAKLNKDPIEVAAGDIVEKDLLLSHSHDGTLAVRVGFTPVRVVCSNTLSMAHKSDASKLIRIKHSQNVKANLDNIRECMNLANQEFEATAEQYRLLATKYINQKDLQKYVRLVFASKFSELDKVTDEDIAWGKEGGHNTDMISTRLKNMMERVLELTEVGKGNNLPSVKGTYWSAFNGITEYLNYESSNNQESRLSNLWYGNGASLNKTALDTAVELAMSA